MVNLDIICLPIKGIYLKSPTLSFLSSYLGRPSDFTVSEDAGIEPRTVATLALTARRSNRTARSHQSTYSNWKKRFFQCTYIQLHCVVYAICFLILSHLLLIRIHAAGGNVATEPTVFKRKTPFPLIMRVHVRYILYRFNPDYRSCFRKQG